MIIFPQSNKKNKIREGDSSAAQLKAVTVKHLDKEIIPFTRQAKAGINFVNPIKQTESVFEKQKEKRMEVIAWGKKKNAT